MQRFFPDSRWNVRHVLSAVALFVVVALAGCDKRVDTAGAPPPSRADPAASTPAPADEPAILREVSVTESVPVLPGALVDIVDVTTHSTVVARATPKSVAWKPSGPNAAIAYPASGAVAFSLTAAQWAAVDQAHGLSVRPSEQPVAAKEQP